MLINMSEWLILITLALMSACLHRYTKCAVERKLLVKRKINIVEGEVSALRWEHSQLKPLMRMPYSLSKTLDYICRAKIIGWFSDVIYAIWAILHLVASKLTATISICIMFLLSATRLIPERMAYRAMFCINVLITLALIVIAVWGNLWFESILTRPVLFVLRALALLALFLWINYMFFGITILFGGGKVPHLPSAVARVMDWFISKTEKPEPESLAEVVLPRRIYVGDSHEINICLNNTLVKERFPDAINTDNILRPLFEVELFAAGVTIDGERKQTRSMTQLGNPFRWSCHFPNSGFQTLSFRVKILQEKSSEVVEALAHPVKVVKVDSLTQRQVWIVSVFLGGLSALIALLKSMYALGLLQ